MERKAVWISGPAYEAFMGRWSALVAARFLERVVDPPGARWLDLGCGTGVLSRAVLGRGARDDIPTRFADFDDYWQPFLGGTGPASGFVLSLDEGAWAVRAVRP